ncbi:STAS domain-containing protein [Actinoplanes sp. NPDC051633]|uniref:STAS domain-containing protein n=1 Tax=Actinoplanes sp. NPDC051633 TaxID=3155670 RepID=UPI003446ECB3
MTPDILAVAAKDGPGDSRILVVAGEIDRDSRHHLRGAAERAIGEGHNRLVLDLAAVTFCDSSGLSLLVDIHRAVEAHDGWLRLVAATPVLRDMLRITNLHRLFTVHDTIEDAIADC